MLEFFQYATSGLFRFLGIIAIIAAIGWSINAALIGFRGKKCDNPFEDM